MSENWNPASASLSRGDATNRVPAALRTATTRLPRSDQLATPIAFCIFNRPDLTERVFQAIARQRPRHLLVISDGPRADRPAEAELVARCREIATSVDWECDLRVEFAESNLGCKTRINSGLTWAFEQHEELIILEDDCLPEDSFFAYAEAMLARYRDDRRVMMISGDQFRPQADAPYDYYFSKWAHIWGWASWRRAWRLRDEQLATWPEARRLGWLETYFETDRERAHWEAVFDAVHEGRIDTWDFGWMYSCWLQSGWTVLPSVNLVTNIGFDARATHTTDADSLLSRLPTGKLEELRHPPAVVRDRVADRWTLDNIFLPAAETPTRPPWLRRRWRQLRHLVSRSGTRRAA
ncbi:MAG: glycosyltransferase family 2 protein [Pirellulaceae bacterium]|nr:hypothetical protein [Planctomycetales bacterium]